MIHRLLILIVLLGITATAASAKIWRVDNVNQADFSILQEAHDGAEGGDTLYVTGSVNHYGGLTLEKTLYIFGPGYFLGENPETQANLSPATTGGGDISFNPGSEGSLIAGINDPNRIFVNTNDIVISRCKVGGEVWIGDNSSNIIVSQNYLWRFHQRGGNLNIFINNNIITDDLSVPASSSAEISNNVVNRMSSLHNSNVTNNIRRSTFGGGSNNQIFNNIAADDAWGTENGNQANVDMSTVFVGEGESSTDGQWQLAENSPAIGAGLGGADIGAFGGLTPYILSGIPSIPAIYFFNAPLTGSTKGGLQVQLKTKGHN